MSRFFFNFSAGIHQIEWLDREVWLIVQPWGELVVAKIGAQILHYQPIDHDPVFWVNTEAFSVDALVLDDQVCATKKTVLKEVTERGGVPLCWPWFAQNEFDGSLPFHGYARNASWKLLSHESLLIDGVESTCLTFSPCESLVDTMSVSFNIVINSDYLQMNLVTQNTSDNDQYLTQALHSYFSVSDSEKVLLLGLSGCDYFDKLDGMNCKHQKEDLVGVGAIDNIYKHKGSVLIKDNALSREIVIEKKGSASTVVWNPSNTASSLNITKNPRGFICVEAANTTHEGLLLKPQDMVSLEQTIRLKNL